MDSRSPGDIRDDELRALVSALREARAPKLLPEDVSGRLVYEWACGMVVVDPWYGYFLGAMARELADVPYTGSADETNFDSWLHALSMGERARAIDFWRTILLNMRTDAIRTGVLVE